MARKATRLDIDAAAPAPRASRPKAAPARRRRRAPAAAAGSEPAIDHGAATLSPAPDVPWWRRRSPVGDRILITAALFAGSFWLSMRFVELENIWDAAVPGAGDVWNQPHRHVQFAAGTLFGWLLLAVYDLLGNRSVTLGEAFRNRPNPGREHIFTPMEPVVQAATIRFYGMQYAAIPIAQALIWGN